MSWKANNSFKKKLIIKHESRTPSNKDKRQLYSAMFPKIYFILMFSIF